VYASVRCLRFKLIQLECFPFYAFNFASATEMLVELDNDSHDYPVIRGKRDLLPLKPMKELKKLSLTFGQFSSILSHGERLETLFPIECLKL
jgi:hypothetical protein